MLQEHVGRTHYFTRDFHESVRVLFAFILLELVRSGRADAHRFAFRPPLEKHSHLKPFALFGLRICTSKAHHLQATSVSRRPPDRPMLFALVELSPPATALQQMYGTSGRLSNICVSLGRLITSLEARLASQKHLPFLESFFCLLRMHRFAF